MPREAIRVRTVDVRDEAEADRWDAFVAAMPEAVNYHRSGWLRVIEDSFGHRAYPLAAENEAGDLVGVLPLVFMKSRIFGSFLVSLPFLNYGGLLVADPRAADALLRESEGLMRSLDAEHVELRHLDCIGKGLLAKSHKVTMILGLPPDPQVLWDGFKAKVRNQVRKAEKSGLTPLVGHAELLPAFYEVFARNMRDLGTPVYSRRFFENVFAEFPEDMHVVGAEKDGKVVAAGILACNDGTVEIPWASSLREYNAACPNNLMYWTALDFACRNGFARFDFGRSTPDEGTFRFKKQWGAQPVPLHWEYRLAAGDELPEINPHNPKYQMAINVWRKLPVALTKLIGPRIVRSIP